MQIVINIIINITQQFCDSNNSMNARIRRSFNFQPRIYNHLKNAIKYPYQNYQDQSLDNDLIQYNKKNNENQFFKRVSETNQQEDLHHYPNKTQKDIFLATVKNLNMHRCKIQKKKQSRLQRSIRLDQQFDIKFKSNTQINDSSEFLQKCDLSQHEKQPQFLAKNLSNDPDHNLKNRIFLNEHFNKPKLKIRTPVKQTNNTHVQKLLRLRENIRLKNISMKSENDMTSSNNNNLIKLNFKLKKKIGSTLTKSTPLSQSQGKRQNKQYFNFSCYENRHEESYQENHRYSRNGFNDIQHQNNKFSWITNHNQNKIKINQSKKSKFQRNSQIFKQTIY